MIPSCGCRSFCVLLWLGICLLFSSPGASAANVWIAPESGLWTVGTNWSMGLAPEEIHGSTYITNAVSKVVTIDSVTPTTNLLISSLTLGGPAGTTNTLELRDVGTNNPLTLLYGSEMKILGGGVLAITNSSVVLTGSYGSGFNVFAGAVTLDHGSIGVLEDEGIAELTVPVRIGRTNAASLTIRDGTMEVGTMMVGVPWLDYSAQGSVHLEEGGILSVTGEFSMADGSLGSGLLEINGGLLWLDHGQTNVMRIGDYGVGEMIVNSGTALVRNVSVGRHEPALGTVIVHTNGLVAGSDTFSIGRFSGATGVVMVAGGQLLVTNHTIHVGREGVGSMVVSSGLVEAETLYIAAYPTNTAQGSMTISGGTVLVTAALEIGQRGYSKGSLVVDGGELRIANDGNTILEVGNGSMSVLSGTVRTDLLLLTNTTGQIDFRGGTLRSYASSVSNGLPFVVGDGTNAARLELLPGLHVFENGLVISSNATLLSCGTIIGAVTNEGTILTNCETISDLVITEPPKNSVVTQGATATFLVIAQGNPPMSFQWFFGDPMEPILDATNAVLLVENAQYSNAGPYQVVVTNYSGSVTSVVASLKVLVPANLTESSLSGTNFTFSFATLPGLNYSVDYKTNLTDPEWLPLRSIAGEGSTFRIEDPILDLPSRFYRIRVE